jgi:flagellar FliL protein
MSKDKTPDAEPKKGGKMKKLLMIGIGAVVLVGAGAGAGIYFGALSAHEAKPEDHYPKLVVRSNEEAPAAEGEEKEAPLKVGTVAVPNDKFKVDPRKYEITYFAIPDAFTTNLADGSGFLQVGISLSTFYDGKVIMNIKRQQVPIRSIVLMVLAEQDPALLATSQGKQQLQRQLTAAINDVLRDKEGFGGIDNVYFTSMVIQ